MLIAEAYVRTDRPSRYLAQLCKHPGQMGGRIRHRPRLHHDGMTPPQIQYVQWSDTHGTIDVGSGRCTLQAGPDSLTLRVEAIDQDSLQRIQHLVAGRLQRIGKRDALQVTWQQAEAADHQCDDPATAAPAPAEKTVPRGMHGISRRGLLGAGLGAAAAMGIAGCGTGFGSGSGSGKDVVGRSGGTGGKGGGGGTSPGPSTEPVRLIGDGSTADTGKQPHQPGRPVPLQPGETPPQFVIFSWDGAGEVGNGLFPRFLELARNHDAAMTFFLSGIYLLPESKKTLYRPPNNRIGASDIPYLTDGHIKETLKNVRQAWLDGHEIGTHFNGHFCAGSGSVGNWTPAQWQSEIDQAVSFVTEWRTNSSWTDIDPLPFDYRKELVGGRTPCLLGQDNLLPTAKKLGWRYDASSPGGRQMWPEKRGGVWDLPLQAVPFPGHSFEVLSMDYNILANQSQNSTKGMPSRYPGWRKQATDAYVDGFNRAYESNRAPFFIGNHFEQWNGGIYMDAVEEALKGMAGKKDARLVSFRQFCDWLDVQDPKILAKLRTLEVGQSPAGGWNTFLRETAA